ncbi:MAG: EVE domain-containing protein [Burkholderiaceae bacterium]|mgnify:CR=1 FL=1|jgi:predicted RNA-binding protein with PUA-like domain|nr:EVE domain-containing protein [Burkholderiaceae bacterium]
MLPASSDRLPVPRFWLMKSEPEDCSVDDALAAPQATVPWTGVRNYQARNFLRDAMQVGDGVLFYHSGCAQPGIVGLARIASEVLPDPTQFDPASPYHDPAARPEAPRWLLREVQVIRRTRLLSLTEMRADPALVDLPVLRRGNRLSITPVTAAQWHHIVSIVDAPR